LDDGEMGTAPQVNDFRNPLSRNRLTASTSVGRPQFWYRANVVRGLLW
jgi:hypothetical protein